MANLKVSEQAYPSTRYTEAAAPSTPASGEVIVYAKTDGLIYGKDDAGLETALSNASAAVLPVPYTVQAASNAASTTSLAVTIAAAASGNRLVVCIGSNARDVNTPTCTNVTFTEVGAANFSTTMYASIYVGVVAGGASGTSVTITATGSNFISADVYEITDALTPTAGTPATLSNTNAASIVYTKIGDISPAVGTFVAFVATQDNGTTTMRLGCTSPFRQYKTGDGTAISGIAYAPGGPMSAFVTTGTTNADFAAVIVPVT